ncbi:type II toxin-antitoxin system RelE/ParE family toxin [Noviherbaspirillum sedimenti]|uniref:Type II toxin-antitoxin system RelE/ParE family toxin n=1 Tax=Noviherbaspirillum sedimenti TaxID=2320865 RepID=A0A3A3G7F7_9BURK|nr:type II toxin-antitoxin system RelE/ParE family toxin [Noviherbaspirillum sedimenti]RJG03575.1 type II toxin-antitoxin system RelE/ParE family toxin [Noviherbaspirillum sedimenti]
MPQVKYAAGAIRDLQRLREFLRQKNPVAANRVGETIIKAVQVLGLQPQIGRPIEDMPDEFHEWLIDFGDSGYVARYRFDGDSVTILTVRHQKEAGF